jgi:hypothetical protein
MGAHDDPSARLLAKQSKGCGVVVFAAYVLLVVSAHIYLVRGDIQGIDIHRWQYFLERMKRL